eukprot:TRINITY_DN2182_c0_g2_i1.p1 TRINITY_DN2182_c0_g2~~TRINITY_DN2182_c0_g2_i1.p1  ORF type:complete len:871 (-),score=223.14 TRINITY_DN2182_c0_g2_i1:97-2625(-)
MDPLSRKRAMLQAATPEYDYDKPPAKKQAYGSTVPVPVPISAKLEGSGDLSSPGETVPTRTPSTLLESDSKALRVCHESLSMVQRHWFNLLEDLELFLRRLGEAPPSSSFHQMDPSGVSVIGRLSGCYDLTIDSDWVGKFDSLRDQVDQNLKERTEATRAMINRLCDILAKRDAEDHKVLMQLTQQNGLTEDLQIIIDEKIATVSKENESLRGEFDTLQSELRSRTTELNEARSKMESAVLYLQDMKQKVDVLQTQLEDAQHQQQAKTMEEKAADGQVTGSPDALTLKRIELLEKELQEEKEQSAHWRKRFSEEQRERWASEDSVEPDLSMLRAKASQIEREATPLFQERSDLLRDISQLQLRARNADMARDELESARNHAMESIEKRAQEIVLDCSRQMATLNARIAVLEAENRELKEHEGSVISTQLHSLVESLTRDRGSLKDENTRLQSELEEIRGVTFGDEKVSVDTVLKERAREIKILQSEIVLKEEAITQMRKEHDELLTEKQTLVAKLALVEEKDTLPTDQTELQFALRKMKEENHQLHTRVEKLMKQIQSRSSVQQDGIHSGDPEEVEMAARRIAEERIRTIRTVVQTQIQILKSELDKSRELNDQMRQNTKKVEDRVQGLLAEVRHLEQARKLSEEGKSAQEAYTRSLEERSRRLESEKTDLKRELEDVRDLMQKLQQECDTLREHKKQLQLQAENAVRELARKSMAIEMEREKWKNVDDMLSMMEERTKVWDREASDSKQKALVCEHKMEEMEGELQALKKRTDKSLSEEADFLRPKVYCSVCHQSIKTTMLRHCGHCFCRGCIDKNLEKRNRQCPICAKRFGEKDLAKIYL